MEDTVFHWWIKLLITKINLKENYKIIFLILIIFKLFINNKLQYKN